MIVIFCESFTEAQEAYDLFINMLEENNPLCVLAADPYMLTVDTDDDLRYVFIDYRLLDLFERLTPDILDVDRFFEDWEAYYA